MSAVKNEVAIEVPAQPKVGDTWYRYEDVRYAAPLDEYEMPMGSGSMRIHQRDYTVMKVTPKGVWLVSGVIAVTQQDAATFKASVWYARFVLFGSMKRFACATKAEALASLVARKTRQAGILANQLRSAEQALAMAKSMQANPDGRESHLELFHV